jgi:AraC-like DNA-binding protein
MTPPRAERTVSARLILPFRRVLLAHGHGWVDEILRSAGVDPAELETPDLRVAHRVVRELLLNAISRSGLSDLGLLAAKALTPAELDIWQYASRCQPDVRRALDSTHRLVGLLHDGSRIDVAAESGAVTIRWTLDPLLEGLPALSEFALALGVVTYQSYFGVQALNLSEVWFPHPRPGDTQHHEALFGCTLRFDAPFPAIRMPEAFMDVPMPNADSALAALLERHAATELARLPKPGFAQRVQEAVLELLPRGEAGADHVARKLGTSARTLHRRLTEEGTTFRELSDDLRRHLALGYLYEKDLALSEIAFILGFSNPNAFHKAFKRWTGTTAGAYRARVTGQSPDDPPNPDA